MYAWIWHRLPGSLAAKAAATVALLAVAVAALFLVVFPYAEPRLPWNNVIVDQPASDDSNLTPSTPTTPVSPTSTVALHPSATPPA